MFKYSSVPAYSFGKYTKPTNETPVPGPGSYDHQKADKFTMKQEITSVKLKPGKSYDLISNNPTGPGDYNLPDTNWKAPTSKFSHAERGKIHTEQIPGPGNYNPDEMADKLKSEKRNIVFGKAERINFENGKTNLPGPGQYESQEVAQMAEKFRARSGYKFDKSKRDGMYKDTISPGPGAYQPKADVILESDGRGYSLGKSKGRNASSTKLVPGPGSYNPQNNTSNRNIKFQKNERINALIKKSEIPGPGQYEADKVAKSMYAAPGIKFSKGQPKLKENNVPGPGNYEIKQIALDKRSAKFTKDKKNQVQVSKVPGPGTYDQTLDQSSKVGRFKFNKDEKSKVIRKEVPGPGTYEPHLDGTQICFKQAKEKRLRDYNTPVPGPGQYNYDPNLWNKHYPKFGSGHKQENKSSTVAPGTYNIPHSIPDVPKYNYPGNEKRKIRL